MEQVSVSNLEELLQTLGSRKGKGGRIFLLFCGDVVEATGESWCSDCVKGKVAYAPPTTLLGGGVIWGSGVVCVEETVPW